MNAIQYLPLILELILVVTSLTYLLYFNLPTKIKLNLSTCLLLALSVSLFISVFQGGEPVFEMMLKIISFIMILLFALKNPRIAKYFLLIAISILFTVQLSIGNFYTKLTPIPFLVLACVLCAGVKNLRTLSMVIIFLAIILEVLQGVYLESRGLLLASFLAACIFFMPFGLVRIGVALTAIVIPVAYPVALTFVFVSLVANEGVIALTASNFERSSMAAWCITHLFIYISVGPGVELFTEEINALKVIVRHVEAEFYDPHHFLLSAWIFVGALSVAILYAMWCAAWIIAFRKKIWDDYRIKMFGLLGVIGVLGFTLSPPDSMARMQVALLVGISLAGLRDCRVLLFKAETTIKSSTYPVRD